MKRRSLKSLMQGLRIRLRRNAKEKRETVWKSLGARPAIRTEVIRIRLAI
jgi:hypothetical protein